MLIVFSRCLLFFQFNLNLIDFIYKFAILNACIKSYVCFHGFIDFDYCNLFYINCVVFYWSFLEFGGAVSNEQLRGTPCVLRTHRAKALPRQIAQITNVVLKEFFAADGHDISMAGVSVNGHGERGARYDIRTIGCHYGG